MSKLSRAKSRRHKKGRIKAKQLTYGSSYWRTYEDAQLRKATSGREHY